MALVLVAGAFCCAAPGPALAANGNGNGNGHAGHGDGPPQHRPAVADATAAAAAAAQPVVERAPAAHAAAARGSSRANPGARRTSSSANSSTQSGGSGRRPPGQELARPPAAGPTQPTQPSPAGEDDDATAPEELVAVAAAPAADIAAAPSAPAVPAATSAAPAGAASSQRTQGRAPRSTTPARGSAPRPAPRASTQSAPTASPTATRPISASTPRATTDDSPAPASPADPITRTVVRVLEVIPLGLRIALGVLASLGLLLAATTLVQTRRRRSAERQRELLLADVGVLQSALLPVLPERIAGARVTAAYSPADGLAAGGDFYDAFDLPGGRTAVVVGDIAGHGRDAVPLTALVRFNLRAYLEAGLSPRAALHVAGNVLATQLGGRQVTIVVAIFDPGSGRLTYACAGHWPPLLLGVASAHVTAASSPPIGAGAATGRRQTTIALAPGATACFYTDGLLEARIGDDRLGADAVADELSRIGADGTAADLLAGIVRRSDSQPDDMAACILTALPGGARVWSVRIEELEVDATSLTRGAPAQFLRACGVEEPHLAGALRQAARIVGRHGTAVIEVRVGEQLAEVRVNVPPAHVLPMERWVQAPAAVAAAG